MRVAKALGSLFCAGAVATSCVIPATNGFAQDTDSLALPTRKGEEPSASKSVASSESADKPKANALSRLSQASGTGNIYGVRKSEPESKPQNKPVSRPKQTEGVASSDSLDFPVRKSESNEKAPEVSKARPASSSKPAISSSSSKTKSSEKSSNSDRGKSEPEKKVATEKSSKPEKPSESAGKSDLDKAKELADQPEDISPDSTNDKIETALADSAEETAQTAGNLEPAADAEPAEVAAASPPQAYMPNMYLPQPQEKRGLLSRIFSRHSSTQRSSGLTQSAFSSDYATRGNVAMPAVLDGMGYNGTDLPIGQEDPYRLASLPSTFRPTDLVQIPIDRCHYGNQLYLRREAAAALINMINDATRQGLDIHVVSAYRDYGHQLRLYNQAVARGGENQQNVARPGKSEHHLGTTVDLTNDEQHCLSRSFGDTAEGRWLAANAHRYGWKMTVMSGNGRRSHNDEPWHLRYLGSSVNAPATNYAVAQTNSQSQSRGLVGSVKRLFSLGRR